MKKLVARYARTSIPSIRNALNGHNEGTGKRPHLSHWSLKSYLCNGKVERAGSPDIQGCVVRHTPESKRTIG